MTWQKRYYMKDEGDLFAVDETPSNKPKIIAFIVVFLLLMVALGFAANYFLNKKSIFNKQIVITPTATQAPIQTPTIVASSSASVTPTGKITPSPSISKSSITIQVLNGSGAAGVAGKMAASLKDLGYTVSSTGNAQSFDYSNIVIEVKKSEPNVLSELKIDLSKDYTLGTASATLSSASSTDAIVIVGK